MELLRLCKAGVLPVWFPRVRSVLDPDIWGELSFIGDVCIFTSFLCLNSGMWVFLSFSVFGILWLLVNWVSWGCCYTTSGIGWIIKLAISGLSIATPEWIRGFCNLNFGLQLEQLAAGRFEWLSLGPEYVLPFLSGAEKVDWLLWVQNSISLRIGLFSHGSHRVGKQFLTFVWLCYCSCGYCCYYLWSCYLV